MADVSSTSEREFEQKLNDLVDATKAALTGKIQLSDWEVEGDAQTEAKNEECAQTEAENERKGQERREEDADPKDAFCANNGTQSWKVCARKIISARP
jgi:hypothetical protein